jgi:hypothetical protein
MKNGFNPFKSLSSVQSVLLFFGRRFRQILPKTPNPVHKTAHFSSRQSAEKALPLRHLSHRSAKKLPTCQAIPIGTIVEISVASVLGKNYKIPQRPVPTMPPTNRGRLSAWQACRERECPKRFLAPEL